ncbi:MAG: GumC family protein, partial [Burkholderiales bacterium]
MSTEVALQRERPAFAAKAEQPEVTQLLLYWRGMAKRKWAIGAFAAVAAIAAAFVTLAMTPIYRATATVLIEQTRARIIAIEEVYSGVNANREHFETQAEVLSSHTLASSVIAKYNLTQHPEFDPRQQKSPFWRTALERVGVTFEKKEPSEKEIQSSVLDAFIRRTTVEPGRLNQLIRVSFDARDPQFAADMANAIVDTYIENDIGTRSGMTKRASDWLTERLSTLRANLEQSERALQQYREREQLVDTKGLAQSGVSRQVEELTRALVEARQKRSQAETAYQQTRGATANLEALPVIQRNPLMARFREIEGDTEKKVAELAKRYGPEHPRMVQAQSELKQARENRQKQTDIVVASLANEYEAARTNEKSVERALAEAKSNVQVINRKEFQLGSLERAVATNRQIYETFLSRSKETSAAKDVQGSAVARVMDPALAPDYPLKPKKRQIVMIVFVLALFFAVAVALLREHLDDTLRTADDVSDKLGHRLLAMLPLLSGGRAKRLATHYVDDPHSVFSEGIRTARTGVLLSGLNEPKKTVLVASSVSNEGKTAVAINLAFAHAHTQRVILLDLDLRQP